MALGAALAAGAAAAGISAAGQGLGAALGALTPEAKAMRRETQKAAGRLRKDAYGFSDAQKRDMARSALYAQEAQRKSREVDLQRAAGSGGGSGLATKALNEESKNASAQSAATMGQVEQQSTAAGQAQKAQDLGTVANRDAQRRAIFQKVFGGAVDTGIATGADIYKTQQRKELGVSGNLPTSETPDERAAREAKEAERKARRASSLDGDL